MGEGNVWQGNALEVGGGSLSGRFDHGLRTVILEGEGVPSVLAGPGAVDGWSVVVVVRHEHDRLRRDEEPLGASVLVRDDLWASVLNCPAWWVSGGSVPSAYNHAGDAVPDGFDRPVPLVVDCRRAVRSLHHRVLVGSDERHVWAQRCH